MHNAHARHRRSPAVKTPPGPLLLMPHGTPRSPCNKQTSDFRCTRTSGPRKCLATRLFLHAFPMTQPFIPPGKARLVLLYLLLPMPRTPPDREWLRRAAERRVTGSNITSPAGARPIGDQRAGRPCALTRPMLSACAVGLRSESDNNVPRRHWCIRNCQGTPLSPSHVYHPDTAPQHPVTFGIFISNPHMLPSNLCEIP